MHNKGGSIGHSSVIVLGWSNFQIYIILARSFCILPMHLFLIHFFRSVWELSACSNLAWDQAIIVPCSPLYTWIRLSIPWVHQKDKLQLFCFSGVSVPNAVIYVPCVCFVLNCFPSLEIIIFILTTFTPSFWVVDNTLIIPVIWFFFFWK